MPWLVALAIRIASKSFSIWSLTQHYADFDVQVEAVLGGDDPFPGAEAHLEQMFLKVLTP